MNNVLRTLVFDGQVSLTLADTTAIVSESIKRHNLSASSALVLSKALSVMTYMSSSLKRDLGEVSLSVQANGEGGDIGVSGNRALALRGYIGNTQATGNERETLGNGALTIIRDDGYNRPFVGSCAIPVGGGVDEAFEEYFRISEQLPTFLKTVVELDEKGECTFAGVAALQPLPFATENALAQTSETDLETLLQSAKEQGIEACVKAAFSPDERVWETRLATYRCNCSREYLGRVMLTLGKAQVDDIIRENGSVQVHCHYCNTDYEFTQEDTNALFERANNAKDTDPTKNAENIELAKDADNT